VILINLERKSMQANAAFGSLSGRRRVGVFNILINKLLNSTAIS
jgi:hypothetical protein